MRIDFIGVGFGRSGSRWLNTCISEHPKISIPELSKELEINYFPEEYLSTGIKNYYKFFKDCDFNKVVGELSTTPIMHKNTAKILKELFPEVKIIIYQRDEDKRFLSQEKINKQVELTNEPAERINQEEYITPFKEHFGKNLLVFNMENPDKEGELNKLFEFLGIEKFKCPSTYEKLNVGCQTCTHPKTRKLINLIKPIARKNKKLYFFLKRKLRLDIYFQRFNTAI
ncbi:MAG: hypothetical protein WC781_03690 [Candidatus Pacearchaeota archaeon]|jgi:hypothetical protein